MPRKTFDNLPAQKRQRFVGAAVDEFSEHPFRQASITRLVATLGIAKGSVYQYFENKRALYQWLVTTEVERHRKLHMRGASMDPADPFASLRRYAGANLAFHLAEPKLARLSRFAFSPTRDPQLKDIHTQIRRTSHVFFRTFLERGQQQGFIRADIDNNFGARVVAHAVGEGLIDTALGTLDCDLATYLDLAFGAADKLTGEHSQSLIDCAVDVVKNAFATPNAIVGALEGGGGFALGEQPTAPLDAPVGVVFEDADAGALADDWWTTDAEP